MEITKCEKCGLKYPKKMNQCPRCDGPPSRGKPMSTKEFLASRDDTYIRYIFQKAEWEQGTKETRQACLAEYDKRFGLENWPAHISKEA